MSYGAGRSASAVVTAWTARTISGRASAIDSATTDPAP
jgi:hypothetical protein